MNAIYYSEYGSADVLRYGEQPTPTPKADQVLVRVRAGSVNPIDWKIRAGDMKLLTGGSFPKVPGRDLAGEVAAVGANVTRCRPGDRVFGMAAGLQGAHAEYALLDETAFAFIPDNLSFAQAAAVPLGALTALQALYHHGQLLSGDRVLINGAAGGVGTFALQLARLLGAGEVTAVCSPANEALVRELGADRVLDHHRHDFTHDLSRYDLVFDAVGKSSYLASRPALRRHGRYVTTAPEPKAILTGTVAAAFSDKKMSMFLAANRGMDLALITAWLRAGTLRPIIDKTFALADTAEAHRYSESGKAAGKIVLSVG